MNLKDQNNPAVLNAIAEIVKKNRDDALQEDQKNATVSTTKYANFKPSSVQEALIGNQHKIDHNKNNKIDAHDFKLMLGKKKAVEVKEEEGTDTPGNGYKHQCAIHVKHSKLGEGRTIYSQHAAPDDAGNIVTIRSLQWPGFTFYHKQGTKKFGNLYVGDGLKNDELHFMIQ
jgi:hypothetical protein